MLPTHHMLPFCLFVVVLLLVGIIQTQSVAFAHNHHHYHRHTPPLLLVDESCNNKSQLPPRYYRQQQYRARGGWTTSQQQKLANDQLSQETTMRTTSANVPQSSYTAAAAFFSTTSTAAPAFSLRRMIRLTLVAFLASEVLSYGGFFARAQSYNNQNNNNNHHPSSSPEDIGTTLRRYAQTISDKYDLHARWETFRFSTHKWFQQARGPHGILNPSHVRSVVLQTLDTTRENGECATKNVFSVAWQRYKALPEKTKFALGGAVGLTSARLFLRLVVKSVKLIGLTYLLLEVLDAFGVIGDEEFGLGKLAKQQDHGGGFMAKAEEGLERLREEVKERFHPRAISEFLEDAVEEDGVTMSGLAAGTLVGFLL